MGKKGNGKSDGVGKTYESVEDAILGALRPHGADGAKYEQLRAEVEATVEDFDDEEYDLNIGELLDRAAICDGLSGAGTIAIAELVRAARTTAPGPSMEDDHDGAEEDEKELEEQEIRAGEKTNEGAEEDEAEGKPLDALPVLAALQAAGEKGLTVEEIQSELEAAGSGRHPLGVVYGAALEAAKAGKVRQEGASEADSRFWLATQDDASAATERQKEIVLTIRRSKSDEWWVLGDLLADSGFNEEGDAKRAEGDVEALVAASVIGTTEEDGHIFYGMTEEMVSQIDELGVLAVLERAGLTTKAATATVDRSKFEVEAAERLERERAERLKSEAKLDRLCSWLEKKGLDPDVILEPEAEKDPTTGETFEFKESRPVDDAERGRMFEERMKLDEKKALARAKLDSAKAAYKAEEEEIDGEVEALKQASKCNSRIVTIEARKIPDWEAKVFRILAVDDDRELGTEPMPRGTQRPLLNTEPGGTPDAAAPAVKAAVDAFVDGMAAKGVKVSASRGEDGVPTITLHHGEERVPAPPPVLVDMAKLTKWQKLAYEALSAEKGPVAKADLAAAVQRVSGTPVGVALAAKLEGAAEELVQVGVVVKGGDSYRVLGAPTTKAAPVADAATRVEELLRREGMLTVGSISQKLGLTTEEVKEVFGQLKKRGALTSDDGRTRGKKYGIAGAASQPEARA